MFNIKDYGAVGDGVHNDLPAYKALVAAVNAAGGGDVLFPPGVYFMDGHQRYNEVPDTVVEPAFKLCTRLRVSGYGAKIDLRGNYHRSSADDKHPITGLYFWKCKHFVVEGFEIDGNLDQMTRDANMIGETWSYGILTAGCSHYTIRDIDVHHHLTDGVLLGHLPAPNENNDEYALMLNVRSRYNGRQGLSLVGMKYFTAENCDFSFTGRTEPYGGHAPGAGVDIEPEGAGAVAEDILFLNCRFHDNKGGNIGAGYASLTRRVTFRDCLVSYPASRGWEGNEHGVILYSEDGVMDNCYLDLGHRNVYLSHGGPSPVARNTLRNCTIRSSRNGIATLHEAEALVEGCTIISTATAPTGEFPWSWNPKLRFVDNYVFRPAASFARQAGVAMRAAFLGGREYAGNRYDTDLPGTDGQYLGNEYGSPIIRDERYLTPQYRYHWGAGTPSTAGVPFTVGNASGAADNVPDAPALSAPATFSATYSGSEVGALRNDVAALRGTVNALLAARREVYEQA